MTGGVNEATADTKAPVVELTIGQDVDPKRKTSVFKRALAPIMRRGASAAPAAPQPSASVDGAKAPEPRILTKKELKSTKANAKKQAAAKVQYEVLRDETADVLVKLEGMGGVGEVTRKVKQALQEARIAANDQTAAGAAPAPLAPGPAGTAPAQDADYVLAVKILKKVGLAKLFAGAQKTAASNRKEAAVVYQRQIDAGTRVQNFIDTLDISSRRREEMKAEVAKALAPLLRAPVEPGLPADRADSAVLKIADIDADARAAQDQASVDRRWYEDASAQLEKLMFLATKVNADPEETAAYKRAHDLAVEAAQDRDYVTARSHLTGTIDAMTAVVAAADRAEIDALQITPIKLDALIDRARALLTLVNPPGTPEAEVLTTGTPPIWDVLTDLTELKSGLSPDTNRFIATSGRFVRASDRTKAFDAADLRIDALETALAMARSAWTACQQTISSVSGALDASADGIGRLEAGVDQAGGGTVSFDVARCVDTFRLELTTIRSDWQAIVAGATPSDDTSQPYAAFESLAAGIAGRLADLQDKIALAERQTGGGAMTPGDSTVDAAIKSSIAKTAFDRAAETCQTVCDRFVGQDPVEAARRQKILDGLRAAAFDATDENTLADVTEQVVEQTTFMQEVVEQTGLDESKKRDEASVLLTSIEAALGTFERELEKKGFAMGAGAAMNEAQDRRGLYTQNFLGLKAEYQKYAATLPFADGTALDAMVPALEGIAKSVKMAIDGLKAGSGVLSNVKGVYNGTRRVLPTKLGGSGAEKPVTLENQLKRANTLRDKINDKSFRLYARHSQVAMLDTSEDLKTTLASDPLATSKKKLDDLEANYKAAREVMAANKKAFKEFKKTLDGAQDALDDYAGYFEQTPKLLKTLEGKIKACKASALGLSNTADGEKAFAASAKALLDPVIKEINDLLGDADKRKNVEIGLQNAETKKAEDKGTFKGRYEALEDALKAKYTELPSKAKDEILELAAFAKKAFETDGLLDVALGRLDRARARADIALAYPEGVAKTSRKRFGDASKQWAVAVENFRASLGALEAKLDAIDAPEAAAAKAEAIRSLRDIGLLFSPTAFSKIADRLADKRANDSALTSTREDGLREVRRFRSYLFKDLRLDLLNKNTFDERVKADLVGLHNALGNLDLNLLRSV